jgi:hypothetical protein
MNMDTQRDRAAVLRDQVKKTWSPPILFGGESTATIAQTSIMLSIAWVFGVEFLGDLTRNQQRAIDSGLVVFNDEFCRDCEVQS